MARIVDLRKGQAAGPQPKLPLRDGREKRVSPLRVRRRRIRSAILFFFVCAVGIIAWGIHALSYAQTLSIQGISVSGTERIAPEEITSSINGYLDDGRFHYLSLRNILVYPKEGIAWHLGVVFPRIRFASVSREGLFSRTLHIAVGERHPYAQWCAESTASSSLCYMLDDTGFVFAESVSPSHGEFETAYTFVGGIPTSLSPIGAYFAAGQFPSLLALLRILQQEGNVIPSRIEMLPDQDFSVSFEQGFLIKASFGQDAEMLARNLALTLSSDALRTRVDAIEYIDLRFGSRIYYKLKGEEQVNI
jgi:hypothetical protein